MEDAGLARHALEDARFAVEVAGLAGCAVENARLTRRAVEDTGLAGHVLRLARRNVEDASLAVEAGFRAVAPCSAIISKNGFENRNACI